MLLFYRLFVALVIRCDLAHRTRSVNAGCTFATTYSWLSPDVVNKVRKMHVQMDAFPCYWVAQSNWITTTRTVCVQLVREGVRTVHCNLSRSEGTLHADGCWT